MSVVLLHGDALARLRELPGGIAHAICTSPPYFGLREYGTGSWEGGDAACDHRIETAHQKQGATSARAGRSNIEAQRNETFRNQCSRCGAIRVDQQIGREATPEDFVRHVVDVLHEARRVLRDDGTCWVVIGDSHANDTKWGGSSGGKHVHDLHGNTGIGRNKRNTGLKSKDLIGVPYLLAFALRADGWYWRSMICWSKSSVMPESVRDRPSASYEHIVMLSKSEKYFFDDFAVAEDSVSDHPSGNGYKRDARESCKDTNGARGNDDQWNGVGGTRRIRNVWTINPEPFAAQMCSACGTYHPSKTFRALPRDAEHRAICGCGSTDAWLSHFACVDAETEALTSTGWRKHVDLQDGMFIAAYDSVTDTLSWESATFHRYPFQGSLVAIEKRDTSQRLTENHRCIVRKKWKNRMTIVEARELNSTMEMLMAAPFKRNTSEGIGESMAAILGWYVTEGQRLKGRIIRIHQSLSANPEKVDIIRHHLHALDADFYEQRRDRIFQGKPSIEIIFVIRGDVAQKLYVLSPDKRIYPAWFQWPLADLVSFFSAAMAGDGHKREDGRQSFIQKDRHTIDMMQIIAILLGKRAHVHMRRNGLFDLNITEGRWLTLRSTNGLNFPRVREVYDGIVWCPSVPSGFWLARRKDKPFITGNTFPTRLVSRVIACSTSEGGCCRSCGAPRRRIIVKGDVDAEHAAACGADASGGYQGQSRPGAAAAGAQDASETKRRILAGMRTKTTVGWVPTCACRGAGEPAACLVLDPFAGVCTTALSAGRLGRDSICIDLNADYLRMAAARLADPEAKCLDTRGERLPFTA
jgi:DNA modification methylase